MEERRRAEQAALEEGKEAEEAAEGEEVKENVAEAQKVNDSLNVTPLGAGS